ncbi:MAG: anti-sigma factor family protein, partial [Longimicrobiales bacterium]
VENGLEGLERGRVERHLFGCSLCQREVAELRGLFAALSRLQHFSPAPGFMSRVMAHVKLPEPWWARAGRAIRPFAPRTSRGWAFASAVLALPLVGFSAVMFWLLSKPYVTGEGLLSFTLQQVGTRLSVAFDSAVSILIQSNLTLLLARGLEVFSNSGLRGAGAAAMVFAGVTILSAWILYQNLFRTTTRRSDYASYSF